MTLSFPSSLQQRFSFLLALNCSNNLSLMFRCSELEIPSIHISSYSSTCKNEKCDKKTAYHMPCHVPVNNFPSLIGIVTLAPISALLICACIDVSTCSSKASR